MAQKDNIVTIQLIKKNGKLVHKPGMDSMYKLFVEGLEDGQEVEAFFEAEKDDGTNPQLAKIHVTIRKLAVETGYSFAEMKLLVKRQSGLCWNDKDGRENCKSFGVCSKEELGLAIEAINEIGETVGISF